MKFVLDPPVSVGTLSQQITLTELHLTSVAFNFEDHYALNNQAILSVCLVDKNTGYPVNIGYQDGSALALWRTLESELTALLLNKMVADGRLPPGSIVAEEEPSASGGGEAS
jgi:hypothetical protein